MDLEVPQLPCVRCPPKKLEQTQSATMPHQFQNIKDKYKANYFELLDVLVNELYQWFNQPGMDNLLRIECIVTGDFEPDDIDNVLSFYSGFLKSKSFLIRQLDALKDLCADHEVSQTLSNVILQMKDIVQKKLHVLFRDILMLLFTWLPL